MVTILPSLREPIATMQAIRSLTTEAHNRGLVGQRWEIGFFEGRDLYDFLNVPEFRRVYGAIYACPPRINGIPCVTTQLEDRITLVCVDTMGKEQRLVIDRRASDGQ